MAEILDPNVQKNYIELLTKIHTFLFEEFKKAESCKDCNQFHDLTVDISLDHKKC
jgi:hypothetical protein